MTNPTPTLSLQTKAQNYRAWYKTAGGAWSVAISVIATNRTDAVQKITADLGTRCQGPHRQKLHTLWKNTNRLTLPAGQYPDGFFDAEEAQ